MSPIRILHVVDGLRKGGLENGLVNIIQRMDLARFEHKVLTMREFGENLNKLPTDRVDVICLEKKETDFPIQIPALISAIGRLKPDVVHSRNWSAIEAVVAARLIGGPRIVHSEHGLEADTAAVEPWRRRKFRRLAFGLADRVLTVSHELKRLHAERTGFSQTRIQVIHNGVDHHKYYPDMSVRENTRNELGLKRDQFCIGCVGSLTPVKDHMTLLRAVERLQGDWRVILIGQGPEQKSLADFTNSQPNLRNRVLFLGLSDRVDQLLNAMDVHVLPSLKEGISNALLEAMATGVPVIATETGGNPEVVEDGLSGILFPVGSSDQLYETLRYLQANEKAREVLSAVALKRVREKFSMDAMVRNYEVLYEGLCPAINRPAEAIA